MPGTLHTGLSSSEGRLRMQVKKRKSPLSEIEYIAHAISWRHCLKAGYSAALPWLMLPEEIRDECILDARILVDEWKKEEELKRLAREN